MRFFYEYIIFFVFSALFIFAFISLDKKMEDKDANTNKYKYEILIGNSAVKSICKTDAYEIKDGVIYFKHLNDKQKIANNFEVHLND